MIAIIDYGAGNVASVKNALDYLDVDSVITSSAQDVLASDRIILPGVGSFGAMMEGLERKKLVSVIKEEISKGKPFLGICLGMQALFSESEESVGVKGLEVFKGKVRKFTSGKVPQIGWNEITPVKNTFEKGYVYFVNSYFVEPDDSSVITLTTDYYGKFVSGVQKGNVTGFQFHPEKSGAFGLKILKRWLTC